MSLEMMFLPIIKVTLVMSIGIILGKTIKVDQKTISRLALYVFTPALVFNGLYNANIEWASFGRLVAADCLFMALLFGLAWFVIRAFGLTVVQKNSFLLSTTLINAGNFGIPMVIFAFGQEAASTAIIIYVLANIYTNTVGVYIASRGQKRVAAALKTVLRMPALYAALTAITLNALGLDLPKAISDPASILAGGAIPTMLILLGVNISKITGLQDLKAIFAGSTLRLIISPLTAFLLVKYLLPLPFDVIKVFVLQMAMPTAANATVLATEFETDAELVAGITLLTTLTSIITLPIVLFLLSG